MRGQLALEDGGRSGQNTHDGCPGQEHIIEEAGMVDVLRLVGDLQARTAHGKVHAVHVNLTGIRLALSGFRYICAFVLEDGHSDVHLLLPSLVDGLRQAEESRVWTSRLLGNEALVSVCVGLFEAILVC